MGSAQSAGVRSAADKWPAWGTVLALLLLGACGGGSGGDDPPAPDPTPTPEPPPSQARLATMPVFSALSFVQPLAMLQAPDAPDRWFVAERAGRVLTFDNDPQTTQSTVFMDIRARVDSGADEAGLLGIAFHPRFADNGELFVSYTRDNGGLESVISRMLSLDGGLTVDPATEQVLLTVAQDFSNHNGGQLLFGPDGFLYIGFGDGGSGNDPNNRAQDSSNLMGAILRIDIDGTAPYQIPPGNPFAANATCPQGFGGAPCPEIFAYGLRNPWRFSFDRLSGTLWAGDVGQGQFEEINRIGAGENFGWRVREGAHCNIPSTGCDTSGLTDPVTEYDRSQGVSVTGGYVYRGTLLSTLAGRYTFGDFGSGMLFAVDADAATGTAPEPLLETGISIASFGEDSNGELYLVDYAGALHQLIEET